MKKIIILILLAMPALCFAQTDEKATEQAKKQASAKSGDFWINCGCKMNNILFVIDGKEMTKPFDTRLLEIEDILTFNVLKDAAATEKYGEAGKDGVILVETKSKSYSEYAQPQYEATVLTPGYEAFVATQKSKAFYTESSLKSRNALMVNEWNSRHRQPSRFSADIYEVSIDYDASIDYGLDLEYTLYMFFKFMEKEHGISLS